MTRKVRRRGWPHALLPAMALGAALLGGGELFAQGVSEPDDHATIVAQLVDRHSDLTDAAKALGSGAYTRVCAACHETGANRAPPSSALANLSPAAILRIVTDGP